MSYNTPAQTAQAAVESGVAKGKLPISSMLVGGFLAGAYIAFGGLLAIVATAGMPAAIWGGLITLVTGLVFSVGLVLTVIGGAELLTGNMMYLPIAALARRLSVGKVAVNWIVVLVGNLIGSLFVAYVLAYKSGLVAGDPTQPNHIRLIAIATAKVVTETHLEVFIRAIGCNWLVCLAVWLALAAHDVIGKIAGIVLPVTAFVALGFDHVVANMFFLPLALFVHAPNVTMENVSWNLLMALLGNIIGGAVFVAGAYWFTYLRVRPGAQVIHPGASEALDPDEFVRR